jgi:enamine deaminase RidA (YjgF/YER057c/UK114 family)
MGTRYTQLVGAIETVATALKAAGADLRHVVRTVIYVVDMADAHHVIRAHQETFGCSPLRALWSRSLASLPLRRGSKSRLPQSFTADLSRIDAQIALVLPFEVNTATPGRLLFCYAFVIS